MIKTAGYVVLWGAGSCAAMAVAWAGVSSVNNGLGTAADVESAVVQLSEAADSDSDSSFGTAAADATIDSDNVLDSDDTALSSSSTSPSPTTTTGTGSIPNRETSQTTPASTSTTGPTSPPTSAATSTSVTTTPIPSTAPPPPDQARTVTFQLEGGTTAISFASSGVTVLWATPKPGFEAKIEPESPGIKVEFRAEHHESRIDAWWADGPQHEIRERAR